MSDSIVDGWEKEPEKEEPIRYVDTSIKKIVIIDGNLYWEMGGIRYLIGML